MENLKDKFARVIAAEVNCSQSQASAAIALLEDGATVPFIARYRKEATGGLDDTQLRLLEDRLSYLKELEARREAILASVKEQGKLTPELEALLREADARQRLEDLYLPFKPKRRTRAQRAREAGLEPLADALFFNPGLEPKAEAAKFLCEAYPDEQAVLNGARDVLAEKFATDAELIGELREYLWETGELRSEIVDGKEQEGAKYRDYFHFSEPLAKIPSHRVLAIFRGRADGVLDVCVALPDALEAQAIHPCQARIAEKEGLRNQGRPSDAWLENVCRWTWRVKCAPALETELFQRVREAAEESAIAVFGANLKNLLLASPAGHKGVIGLDPGVRTGVKVAVISDTGAVQETAVVYPHAPRNDWEGAIQTLRRLAIKFHPMLISIGNGTASRETDRLAGELIKRYPELGLSKVVVSEAGASVYSASALAAKEFPNMDVSYRGAVSIARRLQDPLAELVKIDPKAIGVGQYQHDVNQASLARKLDAVVEDCVNSVGVDINTASPMLLSHVAGLSTFVAQALVDWREAHGRFKSRKELLEVPRLGAKTFEQAAGFLRIPGAQNPLDSSAVHPEAYSLAEDIARRSGMPLSMLIGNREKLRSLRAQDFVSERFGLPTVQDILVELEKPGRDPRPDFIMAKFAEGIVELADLKAGMELEGVVSNVTAFGAFVDVGVHQDGLVHVSELSDSFVRDPARVVHVGQIVHVRVLEVDMLRKRISLTMRRHGASTAEGREPGARPAHPTRQGGKHAPGGAMAAAFKKVWFGGF